MKVVIPGGSGQVGQILARWFTAHGHDVVILSRAAATGAWRTVEWDGRSLGVWRDEVDGADVVINLAGRTVNCRYTPANRAAIMSSRVQSTRVIGEAIAVGAQAAGGLAPGVDGNHLRASIRRAERRGHGNHRRERARRTRALAVQRRRRTRMGGRARTCSDTAHSSHRA